jgi:uncharacterized membrane protein
VTTSQLNWLFFCGILITLVGLDGMRMRKRTNTPRKGIWTSSDMGYMAAARLLLVGGVVLIVFSGLGWIWTLIDG